MPLGCGPCGLINRHIDVFEFFYICGSHNEVNQESREDTTVTL